MTLYHAIELLGSQGPRTLKFFLNRIRESKRASHKAVVSELVSAGVYEALESGSIEDHPKTDILGQLVLEQLSSNPSSKIIVFTQYRDTSSFLVSKLFELGVKAARFIGQADRGLDSGLTQDQQTLLLEKFRAGDLKVLVATSIGEEGLDIPSVDLVVFYEPVPSEIRYIQRRGRTGRRSFGRVVILAAEGTVDVSYLAASKRMAERMKQIISTLNADLNPIIRFGPLPEISPLSAEIISEAEKLMPLSVEAAAQVPTPEPGLELLEKERLSKFNREVREVAKHVLSLVLKVGGEGTSLNELSTDFEEEGRSPIVVKAAVDKLVQEDQVKLERGRILPMGAIVAKTKSKDSHMFEVEKVLLGKAILLVDGKMRAILLSSDYNGPRHLLRKGSRFKAIADLYKLEGTLYARVYAVEAVPA